MAKKRSDTDDVQSRWHQFINGVEVDPALQSFFQRHRGVDEEPRMLFEAVGEDLASSREDRREQAFWILVAGMPELADILHERETRQPGWRSGAGKGQQVVDSGMNIVTSLYVEFVTEHKFDTERGKDPRPYVRSKARNWQIDGWRKERRLVSLDEPLSNEGTSLGSSIAASLADPTSVEDTVVDKLYYEHGLEQLRTWNFLQDEELGWFAETYVAKHPFASLATQFDTPGREAARLRQRRSRARRKAFERLESIVGWYLTSLDWEDSKVLVSVGGSRIHPGGLPKEAEKHLTGSWVWEWIQRAVRLGPWSEGFVYEDAWVVVRPLTHSFDGSPGHIFFISIGKAYMEYIHNMANINGMLSHYPGSPNLRNWFDARLKQPYDWIFDFFVREFLDRKVPVLGLPGLDQAINEALKLLDYDLDLIQVVSLGGKISLLLQS
jgi:hypothetical protein